MAGAGVTIEGSAHRATLCSSDATSARIEDLCFTLGEGPGIDAHERGAPVAEPGLSRPRSPRWPSFTPLAVGIGVAAIFSFPLLAGTVRLGSLTLYRLSAGRLSAGQHADALVMADVLFNAILAQQAELPPDALTNELEVIGGSRPEVHQAAGMLSVQLGMSVADALVRLRAHAFAHERAPRDVARDVIAGRLRLED